MNKERLKQIKENMQHQIEKHGVEGFNDYSCGHELLFDWLWSLINELLKEELTDETRTNQAT